MNKKEIFVGDKLGAVTVLEIIPSSMKAEYRYRVKYDCCGLISWIGHKPLLARIIRKGTMCRTCAGKNTSSLYKTNQTKKHSVKQIYVPGWGLTLGSFNRG